MRLLGFGGRRVADHEDDIAGLQTEGVSLRPVHDMIDHHRQCFA
jgi:hypothetical protein